MKLGLFRNVRRTRPRALVTFRDLSETPRPALLPLLDRPGLDEARLTPVQRDWRRDGVVILRGFLPDAVLDPYIAVRAALDQPVGWSSPTPYLQVPELRRLALHPPLMALLQDLIGEEMMLHLCLTGWISTERNWHQDDYLNPGHVNSWYAAVWIALDTISPDSGPFEYIPGSHRWRLLRQTRVRGFLSAEEDRSRDPQTGVELWPKLTESFVVPAIEAEIRERAVHPVRFLAEKGDVLIWHSRLMHRGSLAEKRFAPRKALITHYSGVHHRPDMPARARDENGMTYALFDHPLQ
jgi:hypothetical protein